MCTLGSKKALSDGSAYLKIINFSCDHEHCIEFRLSEKHHREQNFPGAQKSNHLTNNFHERNMMELLTVLSYGLLFREKCFFWTWIHMCVKNVSPVEYFSPDSDFYSHECPPAMSRDLYYLMAKFKYWTYIDDRLDGKNPERHIRFLVEWLEFSSIRLAFPGTCVSQDESRYVGAHVYMLCCLYYDCILRFTLRFQKLT